MLLILFAFVARFVASSMLGAINPYDERPSTKYYLRNCCRCLGYNHSMKYETDSIKDKLMDDHYRSCLHAVWPGYTTRFLPVGHECNLGNYHSFKRGDVLTYKDKQPSLIADEDGFFVQTMNPPFFVFYHKDKPRMKLDVLEKLPWPRDEDLLAFKDYEIQKGSALERGKQPSLPEANVMLNSKNAKRISFIDFKRWIQLFFDSDKYDPSQLKRFRVALRLEYPNVQLSKIHKLGARTRVVPLCNRLTLIPPNFTIAVRYDPHFHTCLGHVTFPKHSTIIAVFEQEGSTCCLVLTFDIIRSNEQSITSLKD